MCEKLEEVYGLHCSAKDVLNLDSSTSEKFSRHLIFMLPSAAFKDNSHVGESLSSSCALSDSVEWHYWWLMQIYIDICHDLCDSDLCVCVCRAIYSWYPTSCYKQPSKKVSDDKHRKGCDQTLITYLPHLFYVKKTHPVSYSLIFVVAMLIHHSVSVIMAYWFDLV